MRGSRAIFLSDALSWLLFWLLLLAPLRVGATGSNGLDEVGDFGQCLYQLRSDSRVYHRWIPGPVFTADRRLYWMDVGIDAMAADLSLLDRRQKRGGLVPADMHLFWNAVEGCQLYHHQYVARARRFIAMLICICLLVLTLTGRLLFVIYLHSWRRFFFGKPHAAPVSADNPNSAGDRRPPPPSISDR